jgi:hypothetical protein
MVLEHIFPEDWLERKGIYALILGIVYSFIGLLIASVLFPGDPALVAVAFTSLLLLPELYKIFSIEERQESMEQKVSLQSLWKDDVDVVKIYVYLFIGILLVYSVGTMVMPEMQSNTLFREQLEIRFGQGFAGSAVSTEFFDAGLFKSLLSNNFLVLMACFIMALLTGDGAIFLITWNASVWGTIFGLTAKNAASFSGQWPILIFVGIMFVVFCHMIIEVFTFNLYLLLAALITLLIGALVETIVLIMELPIFAFAIIVVILLAVFLITKYFILPFEWRGNHLFNNLFLYFYAFFIALAVMIIFGLPDFGLGTISYQEIIKMSFMASA